VPEERWRDRSLCPGRKAEGALVDEFQQDSPAAKAGLAAGDVSAPLKDSRELARKIGSMAPGTSVKLSILRKGEEKTVALTLGEAPNERKASSGTNTSRAPASDGSRFGLTLAAAGDVAGAGSKGVVVVAVDPGGAATDHGFEVGNIILDVNKKAVSTPSDIRTALSETESQCGQTVRSPTARRLGCWSQAVRGLRRLGQECPLDP
jgi:serine protease Do